MYGAMALKSCSAQYSATIIVAEYYADLHNLMISVTQNISKRNPTTCMHVGIILTEFKGGQQSMMRFSCMMAVCEIHS